ncbi:hypothetical protein EPO56_00805 [Patescibacteria group bacterium]|nr:MAG: hypothetical protein EPO56_00805 [Patescibacteria group bacterium]
MVKRDMERGEHRTTNPLLAGLAFLSALLPVEAWAQSPATPVQEAQRIQAWVDRSEGRPTNQELLCQRAVDIVLNLFHDREPIAGGITGAVRRDCPPQVTAQVEVLRNEQKRLGILTREQELEPSY